MEAKALIEGVAMSKRVRAAPGRTGWSSRLRMLSVRLPGEFLDGLDALQGGAPRSYHVERAIAFYLAAMGEE